MRAAPPDARRGTCAAPHAYRAGTSTQAAVCASITIGFTPSMRYRLPRPSARTRTRSSGLPDPGLVDRHRAALAAVGQRRQSISQPECLGRERREDRGREVGTGEHAAAHLLLHDHRVDHTEAEATALLGNEHARPAEVDDRVPDLRRDARVVVLGHAAHVVLGRFLVEERPHRDAQLVLVGREREVHSANRTA